MKATIDIPDDLYLEIKQMQLKLRAEGKKVNLPDIYITAIRNALSINKNAIETVLKQA